MHISSAFIDRREITQINTFFNKIVFEQEFVTWFNVQRPTKSSETPIA